MIRKRLQEDIPRRKRKPRPFVYKLRSQPSRRKRLTLVDEQTQPRHDPPIPADPLVVKLFRDIQRLDDKAVSGTTRDVRDLALRLKRQTWGYLLDYLDLKCAVIQDKDSETA
ncbi:hypothetical protein SAMN05444161_3555 [Rhizobiales bacterium GAS191]|nr:hypothetical protein SAMN05444161_3555 [Rhizobiales bacterium GAS191]